MPLLPMIIFFASTYVLLYYVKAGHSPELHYLETTLPLSSEELIQMQYDESLHGEDNRHASVPFPRVKKV